MAIWTAKKLRRLRERHGEDRAEFARRLGMSPRSYEALELGRYEIDGSKCLLLERLKEDFDAGRVRPLPPPLRKRLSAGDPAQSQAVPA